jgi:signal transduction histidine kinase
MPGSGLGLAIVKRAVTAHGGTISVVTPLGGGTVVDIALPLENGAVNGGAAPALPPW